MSSNSISLRGTGLQFLENVDFIKELIEYVEVIALVYGNSGNQ